jgi:hypothetical protein
MVASIAIAAIFQAVDVRPTFAASVAAPAAIETVAVIDTSNQAGWWTPLVEYGGATYFAYDAPGRQPGTHVVYVAKRERSGATEASRLTAAGRCLEFADDIGITGRRPLTTEPASTEPASSTSSPRKPGIGAGGSGSFAAKCMFPVVLFGARC